MFLRRVRQSAGGLDVSVGDVVPEKDLTTDKALGQAGLCPDPAPGRVQAGPPSELGQS